MKTRSPLKIFQPRDWCSLSCGNGIENNLTCKDIALSVKRETRQAINNLLKEDEILVILIMPGTPPELKAQGEDFELYRRKLLLC